LINGASVKKENSSSAEKDAPRNKSTTTIPSTRSSIPGPTNNTTRAKSLNFVQHIKDASSSITDANVNDDDEEEDPVVHTRKAIAAFRRRSVKGKRLHGPAFGRYHSWAYYDKQQATKAQRALRRRFSVELSTEDQFKVEAPQEPENEEQHAVVEGRDHTDKETLAKAADLVTYHDEVQGVADATDKLLLEQHFQSYGVYGYIRQERLDYNYHVHYRKERQWLHDSIIEDYLDGHDDYEVLEGQEEEEEDSLNGGTDKRSSSCSNGQGKACCGAQGPCLCSNPVDSSSELTLRGSCPGKFTPSMGRRTKQWFILTVGPKGTGKRYTIDELIKKHHLSLPCMRSKSSSLIVVDVDEIRRRLPEYPSYVENSPDKVGALTRKEAGYIAETLTWAALQHGRTVIFDCSLKDAEWYVQFLQNIKEEYLESTGIQFAMIHVQAPTDVILERSKARSLETGRVDDEQHVLEALEYVPRSIEVVKPHVDDFFVIFNGKDEDLRLLQHNDLCAKDLGEGKLGWPEFAAVFDPKFEEHEEHSANGKRREQLRLSRKTHRRFSTLVSTEENHRTDECKFYGKFSHIRKTLDYSYHSNYTFERQMFQDAIVDYFLRTALLTDKNGEMCTTPTEPWIVFTAGPMGAGKSYTMSKLVEHGRFPLLAFVNVDPDAIRQLLPEFHLYLTLNPEMAGDLTRKEAGFIAEILTLAGLQAGKNVLVDGSLRDWEWYERYFKRLRLEFPLLRLAILQVTAPRDAIFQRASVSQAFGSTDTPIKISLSNTFFSPLNVRNVPSPQAESFHVSY